LFKFGKREKMENTENTQSTYQCQKTMMREFEDLARKHGYNGIVSVTLDSGAGSRGGTIISL
jgi:uncharacterized protein YbjQ (UPF0145 family)